MNYFIISSDWELLEGVLLGILDALLMQTLEEILVKHVQKLQKPYLLKYGEVFRAIKKQIPA